jgi:hypothetical protein
MIILKKLIPKIKLKLLIKDEDSEDSEGNTLLNQYNQTNDNFKILLPKPNFL